MDKDLRETLIAYIVERLTKEVKNIKTMSISTADDYGYNVNYFHKMLDEEFDKTLNSKQTTRQKTKIQCTETQLSIF